MDLEALVRKVSEEVDDGGLVHMVHLPSSSPRSAVPATPLPKPLAQRLEAAGVNGLWSHQLEALDLVRSGTHTIVATGTASGKSLCFNLPVIETILNKPDARALYLYPTKALAQDQLRALRAFALPQITSATYDGDTPFNERGAIRRYAGIVLSNPDMVHFGILPSHQKWADFFTNLEYVVVDEAHVLRGIFGSHVGCILRRLRRIAAHYGSNPTFVMASATIGNPAELAGRLTGLDFEAIAMDGAPRGDRIFCFWNPPLLDESDGSRGSTNWEAARLLASFAGQEVRTIAFTKSRKGAELVAKYAKQMVDPGSAKRIRPYRAGYLASERREIERQLFEGRLVGVAATSALELGVDVGGLDAVVLGGFPGTVAAVWQQAGRAGRSGETSVAVLVGQEDPLDQYYLSHPEALLDKPFEAALVDTSNPNVLQPHIGCAAFELPLRTSELDSAFGDGAAALSDQLVSDGDLAMRKSKEGDRLHWTRRTSPGKDLDIRSLGGESFSIVMSATGALLGTVDGARAHHQVHEGAIYLHQGESFVVMKLDLEAKVVLVDEADGNFYTQSRDISDVRVLHVTQESRVGPAPFFLGKVEVTEQVTSFVRKDTRTGKTIGYGELDLPKQVLQTVAFWYTVDAQLQHSARISEKQLMGALHAAEHAGIGILPLFAMADRWDIGGLSTNFSPDTDLPTVFIYDGYAGGAGIAERGFNQAAAHLAATLDAVRGCSCESGCPSCVQSPKCGNGNEPLDKDSAVRLMKAIVE